MQSAYRAGHANVLATQGNIREAETLFEEAEQRQVQVGLELPYLYSAAGFQYISFLLRSVAPSAFPSLAQRVQETLKIAERNDHLLDIGLNTLNLARIAARAEDETAPAQFDAAIAMLRKAGTLDLIPLGYLARAGFRRAQDDLAGVWDDIEQVRYIAEPSGMRLYLCDALIEEAWLHHLAGDAAQSRVAFEKAQSEVEDMGYHWQDPEIDKLRDALG